MLRKVIQFLSVIIIQSMGAVFLTCIDTTQKLVFCQEKPWCPMSGKCLFF